jgi:serine/threonine-protein kinase
LELAGALNDLGGRYSELDRLDEAEAALRESLQIEAEHLPPDNPRAGIALSNLAEVETKRDKFEEAKALYRRAAEIARTAYGRSSAEYARCLSNLGALYGDWSHQQDGHKSVRMAVERHYKDEALTTYRAAHGERHHMLVGVYRNHALMWAKRKDWHPAASDMEKAAAIMLSLGLNQHYKYQSTLKMLADFWERSGQSEKAGRLQTGDTSDLMPSIREIEGEHRKWVAENPAKRQFGPKSPFSEE